MEAILIDLLTTTRKRKLQEEELEKEFYEQLLYNRRFLRTAIQKKKTIRKDCLAISLITKHKRLVA